MHISGKTLLACLLTLVLTSPVPAWAWGHTGHEAVAYVAWQSMTPATRTRVIELLKRVPTLHNPDGTKTIPGYSEWVSDLPPGLSQDETNLYLFMRAATWSGKRFCVCGELSIRYKQSAVVGETIIVTAAIDQARKKLITTTGEVRRATDNALLATATAKYVPLPDDRNQAFVATLVVAGGSMPQAAMRWARPPHAKRYGSGRGASAIVRGNQYVRRIADDRQPRPVEPRCAWGCHRYAQPPGGQQRL